MAKFGGSILTPAFSNGTVYVAGSDGSLHAVDAKTGTERWRFVGSDLGSEGVASPAVAGQTVLVNVIGRGTIALDAASGAQRWTADTLGSGTPLIGGGIAYVAASADEILALDLSTGEIMGRAEFRGWGSSTGMLSGGVLYVAGTQTLTALVEGQATPIANQATPPATAASTIGG